MMSEGYICVHALTIELDDAGQLHNNGGNYFSHNKTADMKNTNCLKCSIFNSLFNLLYEIYQIQSLVISLK